MKDQILKALRMKYQGAIEEAKANIEIYMGDKKITSLILD